MDIFIGTIMAFGFDQRPSGDWVKCDGSLLPVADNEDLFNIIGNTFGGDGYETFGVPDLRGRIPVGTGDAYKLGAPGGKEQLTLQAANLPPHTHAIVSADKIFVAERDSMTDNPLPDKAYIAPNTQDVGESFSTKMDLKMAPNSKTTKPMGGAVNMPVAITSPYQAVSYCICRKGAIPYPPHMPQQ